jgi:hypothetical protein
MKGVAVDLEDDGTPGRTRISPHRKVKKRYEVQRGKS